MCWWVGRLAQGLVFLVFRFQFWYVSASKRLKFAIAHKQKALNSTQLEFLQVSWVSAPVFLQVPSLLEFSSTRNLYQRCSFFVFFACSRLWALTSCCYVIFLQYSKWKSMGPNKSLHYFINNIRLWKEVFWDIDKNNLPSTPQINRIDTRMW